ncbi:dihydrouridine synthase family protein, putative [Talaromyces stipitatus ATCC 10500]|uniref:tRNA-dihydrouridine(16/17) synthase [NAD(P)(+)] n=1 Tax=Talaromyces stipitatus (strain ATCC 10500 / CBS 375.48 / QM 6759 / NRRL 1006) TaxID=441959 RepID=B8M0R5_TALSN|nr:dihydrouridine synthase family protein, putative [Talaromyces stipitatus ATCC 10500]EED21448.1 dihydrouridine synthase family protein, putative [Talaromyces stipitatus ATCC 10500]
MSTASVLENRPAKLTGREFYKSIGSPKFIVAPMVDRSEFAWRMLTRSFMAKDEPQRLLAYSPMFHARLYNETEGFRAQHFQPVRRDDPNVPFLDGNPAIDRPLFVQFCANDPNDFLEAARLVAPYCDAVDLNLGCPQGIARKGHYGAFLQEDWDLIYKLINRLHTELPVPVTAKFRIQETKEKTLEYAKMILSAGASIITVHGRRREQKGHNTGVADWSYIKYLRENLPPKTVIFANGNILNHGDIEHCLEATGADGVMSAEGNLSDPTIFSKVPEIGNEGREYWRGRDGRGGYRMDAVFRRYMDIIHEYVLGNPVPERKPLFLQSDPVVDTTEQSKNTENHTEQNGQVNGKRKAENDADGKAVDLPSKKQKRSKEKRTHDPNLVAMQGHLFQLLRALVSQHTHIRDALARTHAGDIASFERILSMVEDAVKEGILEYEKNPEAFDKKAEDADELQGSQATIAEYSRPWWVCQPYIRPLPEEAIAKGAMQMSKKDQRKAAEAANTAATHSVSEKTEPVPALVSA